MKCAHMGSNWELNFLTNVELSTKSQINACILQVILNDILAKLWYIFQILEMRALLSC